MGKQYNKVEKQKRRKRYIKRTRKEKQAEIARQKSK